MATSDNTRDEAAQRAEREAAQRRAPAAGGDAKAAERRGPTNREYTTARGTPHYSVQPPMTDASTSTSLAGDPAPGTPDEQLTAAQRKQRDQLRRDANQPYTGVSPVSTEADKQTSGVTGVSTTGGVATVTTGPTPEGTPNPAEANKAGEQQPRKTGDGNR